ncbi:SDR family NAD(P)-dependent oxidoreductase [Streptomyces sp. NPDC093586]|uniref:SDR family NAD(P)-dependent oxidoreductase n=1 Tax=Streptomyces sp. NPDC093586 TaxID=3366042 RepID=UPI003823D2B0
MRARHGDETSLLPRPDHTGGAPAAVITGAGRGPGQAIARRLHRDGYQLVLGDIDGPRARATADEPDTRHTAVEADITRRDAADEPAAVATERHGRPGVRGDNADVMPLGRFRHHSPDVLPYACEVNLGGIVRGSRAAIEHMRPRGGGRIIEIAGITAVKPLAGFAVHGATKAAVVSFSQSPRRELRHGSIHVTAVLPHMITTPMAPGIEPRLLRPLGASHVADAVARAITKRRATVHVPRTARFPARTALLPQRVQDVTDDIPRMDDVASAVGTPVRAPYDDELIAHAARSTTA